MHVDELIQNVVTENSHDCLYKLAKKRIEFFKWWQARAKDIDRQGAAFYSTGAGACSENFAW